MSPGQMLEVGGERPVSRHPKHHRTAAVEEAVGRVGPTAEIEMVRGTTGETTGRPESLTDHLTSRRHEHWK